MTDGLRIPKLRGQDPRGQREDADHPDPAAQVPHLEGDGGEVGLGPAALPSPWDPSKGEESLEAGAFAQEYLCTFPPPDPAYEEALKIWARYYYNIESYDRWRCPARSPRIGDAIPTNHLERIDIQRNAKMQRRLVDVAMSGSRHYISKGTWRQAMKEAGRLSMEDLKDILEAGTPD